MSEELKPPHPDAAVNIKAMLEAIKAWSKPYRIRIWRRMKIIGLWIGIAAVVAFAWSIFTFLLVCQGCSVFVAGYSMPLTIYFFPDAM